MNFNWVDITILIILAYCALRGLLRGFIRAVFDILAVSAALFLGFQWYNIAALYLTLYIKLPGTMVYIISFILIFIAAYLATTIVGNFIHSMIGKGILGPLNLLGGAAIGLIKGLIIVWMILQSVIAFPLPKEVMKPLAESKCVASLKPVLDQTSQMIFKMLPANVPNVDTFFNYKTR